MHIHKVNDSTRTESLNSAVIKLLCSSILISILLTASILEFNVIATFALFFRSPALTLFSIFVILTIQLLILSIINELKITMSLGILFSILIAAVNYLKIEFRAEPLIPNDLAYLFDLPAILRLVSPFQIMMMALLIILFVGVIAWLFYKERKYQTGIKVFEINKQSHYRRALLLVLSFVLLLSMRSYQVEGSLLSKTLDSLGFEKYESDILKQYRENGFVNGYISSISDDIMKEPEGYSQAQVEAIMDKYEAMAKVINAQSKYDNFDDISVVMILSESLSNPQRVNGVTIDSNPLPFISNPQGKVYQGLMVPPVYGGTTSNTEFEILTGLSMKYLASASLVPYKSIIPEFDSFPSIVSSYKKNNQVSEAIALHSYTDRLFRRREVFDTFGFDQAYFNKEMVNQDKLGDSSYISDEATFKEVLSYLDSDISQFMHVITMQNHSPFGDKYESIYPGVHIPSDPDLEEKLSAYVQGIHYSDQAIEAFIDEVMDLDKKVVVVYYGDHLPGLYNSLLQENNDPFDLYKTDFFITKNFDMDPQSNASDVMINASTMGALTHLAAGVKLNPLHVLNIALNQEVIGGTAHNYLLDETTVQYEDLDDKTKALIEEYKMIQYDLLVGEQYSLPYLNK